MKGGESIPLLPAVVAAVFMIRRYTKSGAYPPHALLAKRIFQKSLLFTVVYLMFRLMLVARTFLCGSDKNVRPTYAPLLPRLACLDEPTPPSDLSPDISLPYTLVRSLPACLCSASFVLCI